MYIDFTSKQYSFILHALTIMITFYSNDFSSICKEVGEAYGASEADIASACATLTAINVTAPVKSYSDKCSEILEDMLHHARELPEKDAPYKYSIGLDTPSWKAAAACRGLFPSQSTVNKIGGFPGWATTLFLFSTSAPCAVS